MSTRTQNAAIDLALTGPIDAAVPHAPEMIEREVIVLFDEFRDRLLRYVVSIGLSVHDGEDVVQEVFLNLFRHLKLGGPRANLRGWVFRVAHNLALKQRNGRQKQQARIAADTGAAATAIDPRANPEEQLANSQRQQRLQVVMQALPELDRWCLYLRAEGLRYREIAGVVGMSLGAVSNSIAKSMERLMRADRR
ncbi:MAG TPA: RNA polymerase sigma factor [Candidatus Acidoferrum sp.]|nr:RNA polymerase sigma factor [Candidatus Acidoferrum sp.]